MLSVSKKLYHAVEAILYIAYNASTDPISSKEIAAKQKLPPRYLEQMMQKLVRHHILRGVRGPSGGYLIAKEKRLISLLDICNALREEDEIESYSPLGMKVIKPNIERMLDSFEQQLGTVTIATLCEQAAKENITKTVEETQEFYI